MRANTRVPDEVIGDLHAMMAANDTAIRNVCGHMDEREPVDPGVFGEFVMERSDTTIRAAIRAIPNRVYRHRIQADGYDDPVTIECAVHVEDGAIRIDYAGTSPQVVHPLTASMLTDRKRFAPRGMMGGGDGAPTDVLLESGKPIAAKGHSTVAPGDCLVILTAGGAGYGDPAARVPAQPAAGAVEETLSE